MGEGDKGKRSGPPREAEQPPQAERQARADDVQREEPQAAQAEQLTGDELQERARELDVEGRSTMSADELREAVAKKERDDSGGGGAQTPPTPPAPTGTPEGAQDVDEGPYDKDVLITHSRALLGQDTALARGVLAEAPDELTIGDAKTRIQEFLDGVVTGDADDTDEEA